MVYAFLAPVTEGFKVCPAAGSDEVGWRFRLSIPRT